ncbi:MAG: AraC family transcriptional regulator [Clostridiaceae bacterium]
MNRDYLLHENMDMMDPNLPIIFHKDSHLSKKKHDHFTCHWHETIELLYFTKGEAQVKCNSLEIPVKKGDLVVVNSNELHQAYCISPSVKYHCIIFDTSLFQSRHVDTCEAKYINPISQNRILFKNKIENNREVAKYINEFVKEFEMKEIGYEMAVKATLFQLLVFLLRNNVQLVLTQKEYDARMKSLKRFNSILEYVENNYADRITIDQLCDMAHISRFYFCRVFKSITGKSLGEYLNQLRINKAEALLKDGDVNITEAAISCGFDDINYFSRVFKKYKKKAPSIVLRTSR